MKNRLIILAGPSCVGKSPLDKAMKRFYPEFRNSWQPLVLYNSRAPRPGELDGQDYHFSKREEIEELSQKSNYIVMDVRGDLQALDMKELKELLKQTDVFFEGNPFVGKLLLTDSRFYSIPKTSVFMSPLSKEEIIMLKDPSMNIDLEKLVTDIMRRKLLRRTKKQKRILSLRDLEEIERRAGSAFIELQMAHLFDAVIPNHDGEDSEHWDAFYYPIGDAGKAMTGFAEFVEKGFSELVEDWKHFVI